MRRIYHALPLALLAVLLAAACSSYTKLPLVTRTALQQATRGRVVATRVSFYYGLLYDDNERLLLSQRPFAYTTHIKDLDGAPIHPEEQLGVIPAGTRFSVSDIEFPDQSAQLRRMLKTPRYNPWLILRLVPGQDPFLPVDRRPFVIVLPAGMERQQLVEQAMDAFVGEPEEVAAWLSARAPEIGMGIKHKEPRPGMTFQELVAAMGFPLSMDTRTEGERRYDVADYGFCQVELRKGKVVSGASACGATGPY